MAKFKLQRGDYVDTSEMGEDGLKEVVSLLLSAGCKRGEGYDYVKNIWRGIGCVEKGVFYFDNLDSIASREKTTRKITLADLRGETTQNPAKSEWSGEGIPPVGTECEATWGTKLDGWHRAVIVETFKGGAVFAFKWADGWDFVDYDEAITAEFRPLQSEEQKQVAEIEQLLYTMSTLDSHVANIYAKAIYNAGFRKVVE